MAIMVRARRTWRSGSVSRWWGGRRGGRWSWWRAGTCGSALAPKAKRESHTRHLVREQKSFSCLRRRRQRTTSTPPTPKKHQGQSTRVSRPFELLVLTLRRWVSCFSPSPRSLRTDRHHRSDTCNGSFVEAEGDDWNMRVHQREARGGVPCSRTEEAHEMLADCSKCARCNIRQTRTRPQPLPFDRPRLRTSPSTKPETD